MPSRSPPLRERRIFVDSSSYLALLDRDDEHHDEAIEILQALAMLSVLSHRRTATSQGQG